jgi:hypothetical protein
MDIIIIIIQVGILSTIIQIIIRVSNKKVIRNNIMALAIVLISDLE